MAHALTEGNKSIWIGEKMHEFSCVICLCYLNVILFVTKYGGYYAVNMRPVFRSRKVLKKCSSLGNVLVCGRWNHAFKNQISTLQNKAKDKQVF